MFSHPANAADVIYIKATTPSEGLSLLNPSLSSPKPGDRQRMQTTMKTGLSPATLRLCPPSLPGMNPAPDVGAVALDTA